MGLVTDKSRTLGEASEYSIEVLQEILTDLRPYVWVVGSYANDCQRIVSDIDLMPKRKPLEVFEAGDNEEEYYLQEIRDVLAKHGLKNERGDMVGAWIVFWHRYLDIYPFVVPKNANKVTKTIPYVKVEMECLEYDRDEVVEEYDDGYDGFECDWEWD